MQTASSWALIGWNSGQTTLLSLYGTEWRERGYGLCTATHPKWRLMLCVWEVGGGGGEGPAWDCFYAPAGNIPRNFLDLAFERIFLSLAW
jgi:hypothetical protein